MNERDIWAQELSAPQLKAVRECDHPLLVIAGAGSGKTRVLTYKIAYLISERGLQPWQILALTFTNKAAREMNERISRLIGAAQARGLWSGTFHSIFARILRTECAHLGFPHDYSIYDQSDSKALIKRIIKEQGLDEKTYKETFVQSRISEAKNDLLFPEDYAASDRHTARDKRDNIPEVWRIYKIYAERCQSAGAMDFDDLLLQTYHLFHTHPEVLAHYAERFRYVLVDEYQDTNYAQHCIVRQLTASNPHVCVVGDDAQSIYSFRGAKIDNILGFTLQYEDAKTVKLEENYRSTQRIVSAANGLIHKNTEQIEKTVYSTGAEGERLHIVEAITEKDEAQRVAREIKRLAQQHHLPYDHFAVLYRTNSQSRPFEEVLGKLSIPYRIYGGNSFYQRKEIKDTIAYLRLIVNPADDDAFRRCVNYPVRGIGQTTLQHLMEVALLHGQSLWNVACDPTAYDQQWPRGATKKLVDFCILIDALRQKLPTTSAEAFVELMLTESGIAGDLGADKSIEGETRRENVSELVSSLHAFATEWREAQDIDIVPLTDFLAQVALLTDADQRDDDTPRVTLMTIHAAKGLEFDTVFVTGLEEDLFPTSGSKNSPRLLQEERRLLYVAITRAKTRCYLSYAQQRWRYSEQTYPAPSPFLRDLPSDYLDYGGSHSGLGLRTYQPNRSTPAMPPRTTSVSRPMRRINLSSSPAVKKTTTAAGGFSVGDRVSHPRFGTGTITTIEGSGASTKVQVKFDAAGEKTLLLAYAKFTRL